MMYKVVVCAFMMVAVAVAEPNYDDLSKSCLASTKATEAEKNDFFEKWVVPKSQEGKCLVLCLMKGMKMFNDQAMIVPAESVKLIMEALPGSDRANVEKVVNECRAAFAEKKTDDCDHAAKTAECLAKLHTA